MKSDFVDDLIHSVARVVTPNVPLLKEVLVIGGMPDKTQNLQYLSYNRDTTVVKGRCCEFSAVAVINNRRVGEWRLSGYPKKISHWVLNNCWIHNPLDLFLGNLRCDATLTAILGMAASNYTLLGILTTSERHGSGLGQRRAQYISPVVAVPDLDAEEVSFIQAFESANRIKKSGLVGLQVYRKSASQMAGA
jgi:hypothetical protein